MKLSVALEAVTDRKQDVGKLLKQRRQTSVNELILWIFFFFWAALFYL